MTFPDSACAKNPIRKVFIEVLSYLYGKLKGMSHNSSHPCAHRRGRGSALALSEAQNLEARKLGPKYLMFQQPGLWSWPPSGQWIQKNRVLQTLLLDLNFEIRKSTESR